tara:strand:- start:4771 stop:5820 length:1050 start_codon:yes stop_codon:yes gene_type:complete
MRHAARYVVETHAHISTLYEPVEAKSKNWQGVAVPVDNSAMCLYDMERYGIDMTFIKPPSQIGPPNEMHAEMVDRHPDKFRAFCTDQTQKLKVAQGEAEWDIDSSAAEVDAALATGRFIGIGEFVPRDWDSRKVYTFEERLGEFRIFMELARKHGVTIDYHEFSGGYEWDHWRLLARLAAEYPDVPIIVCHAGHSGGAHDDGPNQLRNVLRVTGGAWRNGRNNIYLETGTWPAEFFKIAMDDPNVGVTQLIWGGDYGSRQYILTSPGRDGATFATFMRKWQLVAPYQVDWWGTSLHRIDKVRDFATQDEINLILGGNAARLFNLPMPHDRMFMRGRPDAWGVYWEDSLP